MSRVDIVISLWFRLLFIPKATVSTLTPLTIKLERSNICLLDTSNTMTTKIKDYRQKLGLTQDTLAQITGVRRETIVFLEQGKYMPSLKLAHDVAVALKTDINELFIF